MSTQRLPTFFVSHGGGPWPWIDGMKDAYAITSRELARVPQIIGAKPKAILVVSGHWEAPEFTVSTAAQPPMVYDYYGFPPHTYGIQYKAPGSPALAAHVTDLLKAAGIRVAQDDKRGFDHGTFVPLALMFPDADVPVVSMSIKSSMDPAEHIRLGQALAPLREEGVLIIGSGLTYHNMRGFRHPAATPAAEAFERFLNQAVTQPDAHKRNEMLTHWQEGPAARASHPREDHLIPLMVVAGAAGDDVGRRLFLDHVMDVDMASYEFGALTAEA